jgi:hypothetical protein
LTKNCKSDQGNPKINEPMSQFDSAKDYYDILGADERVPQRDLDRLYKRLAARRHPDKGGSEEDMKSLNEAYRVLRDEETRREYDAARLKSVRAASIPVSAPAAKDVGLLGHGLSAFFCLLLGLFLLFLVRMQWIWFLWPLAILALFGVCFGVLMARSAMHALNASLPHSSWLRKYMRVQEAFFWVAVAVMGYGLYLLLRAV